MSVKHTHTHIDLQFVYKKKCSLVHLGAHTHTNKAHSDTPVDKLVIHTAANTDTHTHIHMKIRKCVCVYVCACVREREKDVRTFFGNHAF